MLAVAVCDIRTKDLDTCDLVVYSIASVLFTETMSCSVAELARITSVLSCYIVRYHSHIPLMLVYIPGVRRILSTRD